MNNKKPNNDLIKTINPATGKIIKTYTIMSDSTINEIINNTHNAFNLWKKSSFLQRSEKQGWIQVILQAMLLSNILQ